MHGVVGLRVRNLFTSWYRGPCLAHRNRFRGEEAHGSFVEWSGPGTLSAVSLKGLVGPILFDQEHASS